MKLLQQLGLGLHVWNRNPSDVVGVLNILEWGKKRSFNMNKEEETSQSDLPKPNCSWNYELPYCVRWSFKSGILCWILLLQEKDGWWVMGDGWWVMGDGWWVMLFHHFCGCFLRFSESINVWTKWWSLFKELLIGQVRPTDFEGFDFDSATLFNSPKNFTCKIYCRALPKQSSNTLHGITYPTFFQSKNHLQQCLVLVSLPPPKEAHSDTPAPREKRHHLAGFLNRPNWSEPVRWNPGGIRLDLPMGRS